MHPYMTAELVRQLRGGLEGESRNQRLIRQLPPRARTDPERGRVTAAARTLARQVRALVGPDHLNPPPTGAVMTTRLERSGPGATTGRSPRISVAPGPSTLRPASSPSPGVPSGSGPSPVGGSAWGASTSMSCQRLASFASGSHQVSRS